MTVALNSPKKQTAVKSPSTVSQRDQNTEDLLIDAIISALCHFSSPSVSLAYNIAPFLNHMYAVRIYNS